MPDVRRHAAVRLPVRARDWARRRHSTHLVLKALVGLLGTLLVAAGLAMLVLPGPGWAAILLGLLVLASEFDAAERMRDRLARRLRRALRRARRRGERPRAAETDRLGGTGEPVLLSPPSLVPPAGVEPALTLV